MRQHTSSAQHRAFATNASNYKALDEMFAKIKLEAHLPRGPVLDILPQEELLERERANFLMEMATVAAASGAAAASASSLPIPEDDDTLFGPAAFSNAVPAVPATAAALSRPVTRAGEMMAVDAVDTTVKAQPPPPMDVAAESAATSQLDMDVTTRPTATPMQFHSTDTLEVQTAPRSAEPAAHRLHLPRPQPRPAATATTVVLTYDWPLPTADNVTPARAATSTQRRLPTSFAAQEARPAPVSEDQLESELPPPPPRKRRQIASAPLARHTTTAWTAVAAPTRFTTDASRSEWKGASAVPCRARP